MKSMVSINPQHRTTLRTTKEASNIAEPVPPMDAHEPVPRREKKGNNEMLEMVNCL